MSAAPVWSIRRRLAIWLLGPMLLVGAVLFADAYRSARESADHAYDRVIAASLLAIAERVVTVGRRLDVDLPYVALEMLATDAQDRVFYRIAGPDGRLVTGYADLPSPPDGRFPKTDEPVFYDARYHGEDIRVAALTRPVTGPGARGRFAVQVAQTRGQRDILVHQLAIGTASRLLALAALVAVCTWFGIHFGLRPLARLRAAIRERAPGDLRPLEVPVPREVRDLVGAIDSLMERLDRTLRAMEQFISDAAHQLRTPLAALLTQVELALRETDPKALRDAVVELQGSTLRTSRLANQLLDLARSTAGAGGSERSVVDVAAIASGIARDLVPAALAKDIDLGFDAPAQPAIVDADPVLLGEMIRNLVDNAVRYCPNGARVTVRVGGDERPGWIRLEVEDDGPGIPPSEREHVLERFHRGAGRSEQGSGLGLAIAREVAIGCGGALELHGGEHGGLRVRVRLPRGSPQRPTT